MNHNSQGDESYYLKLLREMRSCAEAGFELEMKRLDWITGDAQMAFAVLGVGLSLMFSRADVLLSAICSHGAELRSLILALLAAAGALLWLSALWSVTAVVIAPNERVNRLGVPNPRDLYASLRLDDEPTLIASVAEAYARSADANRIETNTKMLRLRRAFILIALGFVLLLIGTVGLGIDYALDEGVPRGQVRHVPASAAAAISTLGPSAQPANVHEQARGRATERAASVYVSR